MISDAELDRLEALCDTATEAPWQVHPNPRFWCLIPGEGETDGDPNRDSNAAFVAAARNALPALIAELREARKQRWQPIETAPKDASDILGWQKFLDVEKTWFSRHAQRWVYSDAAGINVWMPTHWQPLPAPPEATP